MAVSTKKSVLTPDDIQAIADLVGVLITASEERSKSYFASKDEMKSLIRDTVGQVVEEKIQEHVGRLPIREEFFERSDRAVGMEQKNEQELLILTHQYQRQDERITRLESDVLQLKQKPKKSPLA